MPTAAEAPRRGELLLRAEQTRVEGFASVDDFMTKRQPDLGENNTCNGQAALVEVLMIRILGGT